MISLDDARNMRHMPKVGKWTSTPSRERHGRLHRSGDVPGTSALFLTVNRFRMWRLQ